ncbi:hypothetical protein [Iningainema tapete]|uniref:hypothetical protein n=1 Tax=Iningainema tapete TaxID=2806730 RepID=UPI0030D7E729
MKALSNLCCIRCVLHNIDEDGVLLIDELRLGRDPFHYESPSKKQQNQSVIAKKTDIEL